MSSGAEWTVRGSIHRSCCSVDLEEANVDAALLPESLVCSLITANSNLTN